MIEIDPTIKNIEFYYLYSVIILKYKNSNWDDLTYVFNQVVHRGVVFEYQSTRLIDSDEDIYIDILVAKSEVDD